MEVEDSYQKIRRNLMVVSSVMILVTFSSVTMKGTDLWGMHIETSSTFLGIGLLCLWLYSVERFREASKECADNRLMLRQGAARRDLLKKMCLEMIEANREVTEFRNFTFDDTMFDDAEKHCKFVSFSFEYATLNRDEYIRQDKKIYFTPEDLKSLDRVALSEARIAAGMKTTYFTDHVFPAIYAGLALVMWLIKITRG